MVKVIVIRHGEREDHVNTEWQNSAHRPHDSPLSVEGVSQAKICGKRLLEAIGGKEGKRIVTLASPLQRCVVTAKVLLGEFDLDTDYAINIDEAFAEGNSYLRNRMFGNSKTSNKKNMLTGKPRGLTTPVLLGPGDLVGHAHPVKINLEHRMLHKVFYSSQGYELLKSVDTSQSSRFNLFRSSSRSVLGSLLPPMKRFEVVIPKFKAWLSNLEEETEEDKDLIVIVVTHGAIGSSFTMALTGEKEVPGFQYCTTVQIAKEGEEFKIVDVWDIPGLEPKASKLA